MKSLSTSSAYPLLEVLPPYLRPTNALYAPVHVRISLRNPRMNRRRERVGRAKVGRSMVSYSSKTLQSPHENPRGDIPDGAVGVCSGVACRVAMVKIYVPRPLQNK